MMNNMPTGAKSIVKVPNQKVTRQPKSPPPPLPPLPTPPPPPPPPLPPPSSEKVCRVELCTELSYAIISFLLICYPYILLHFCLLVLLECKHLTPNTACKNESKSDKTGLIKHAYSHKNWVYSTSIGLASMLPLPYLLSHLVLHLWFSCYYYHWLNPVHNLESCIENTTVKQYQNSSLQWERWLRELNVIHQLAALVDHCFFTSSILAS